MLRAACAWLYFTYGALPPCDLSAHDQAVHSDVYQTPHVRVSILHPTAGSCPRSSATHTESTTCPLSEPNTFPPANSSTT